MTTTHAYRPLHFGVTRGVLTAGEGGVQYLRAEQPLEPNAECMTDRLVHWAHATPERTLYARRDPALGGEWRHLSFAQALEAARCIGQACWTVA